MKLIRLITSGALLLFFSTGVVAQNYNNDRISKFGVKAGYSHASFTQGSNKNVWNNDDDARSGFYAGVFYEFSLTNEKGFSIQPEVLYSQQGNSVKYDIAGVRNTVDYKFDYINVPILAKIYLADWVSLYGGPTVGFKVSEKVEFSNNNNNATIGYDSDDIQTVDVSLTGGVSFEIGNRFFIEGRYNHGIKPVVKNGDMNNSTIQAGVGFKF